MAARSIVLGLCIQSSFIGMNVACTTGTSSPRPIEQAPLEAPRRDAPKERKDSARPGDADPSHKPPPGYRRMTMGGVAPLSSGSAWVLVDDADRRGLVLAENGVATSPLALHLARAPAERPTAALLQATVRHLGAIVVAVRLDRADDDTVTGSVLLAHDGNLSELEARPTDALSLGFGTSVPVYVAESVLARAGVELDKFDYRRLRTAGAGRDEVEL
ncbi:MAG TPA: bifunctional nuclease domain-containing protein [Polyangiaceae bacterium]|nr:bifunctional nuclease domain-containing protein [Polyangiaceae bacterium]